MKVDAIANATLLFQRAEYTNVNTLTKDIVRVNEFKSSYINTEEYLKKDWTREVVQEMNDFIMPMQTELKFVFHDKLEEYYVTLINPETKEVIQEIPPKRLLDVYASMAEFLGFIVDRKI
ncbi:hypothetical protein GCM10011389_18140 [Pontibacillus salipaludis]|uniref:Flagellar protein FlaG n=1 Tax=Pontibacillus salipaludis TaxID=1697394 RepID=A0ABQ1Q205_9BACI|nr:hypothetical protein GCM10011389_18140 [Pontibacillus salipaludis]